MEPLGFNFDHANLRRAGLLPRPRGDGHATLMVRHRGRPRRRAKLRVHAPARARATRTWPTGTGRLLFGRESTDCRTRCLRTSASTSGADPHVAGRRSLNLANSASIALYEAWRQPGFPDGRDPRDDAALPVLAGAHHPWVRHPPRRGPAVHGPAAAATAGTRRRLLLVVASPTVTAAFCSSLPASRRPRPPSPRRALRTPP
ncbi:hypothetical protein QJS66_22590 [Kocuria rhizophila]|nr:hypothetical protein QJS66_22590 [Kocuria rhizophila]